MDWPSCERAEHQPWKPLSAPSAGNRPGTMLCQAGPGNHCSTHVNGYATKRKWQGVASFLFFSMVGRLSHSQMIWEKCWIKKKMKTFSFRVFLEGFLGTFNMLTGTVRPKKGVKEAAFPKRVTETSSPRGTPGTHVPWT